MAETQEIQKREENLPALRPARLPYHPIIKKEFGYDEHAWKALVEAIFPSAKTSESVRLALSYCRARKLDPFKRCIHIIPIWDSNKRCEVDTIWPGIGELRTTAHRTGVYAGRDKTEFGPMIEEAWGGGNETVTIKFPEWAQVTVYRMVKKQRVAYAGPQMYWMETFSSVKSGAPNSMWRKRPRGQLDKCAEAAALRAAFPEEVGNDYIDAEAHTGTEQRKSFEAAQENASRMIAAESGSEPIDTNFESDPPCAECKGDPPDLDSDEDTQAKVEAAKKALREAEANAKPAKGKGKKDKSVKSKYHCNNNKCGINFDEDPASNPVKGWQCPKCLIWGVSLNHPEAEPAWSKDNVPDPSITQEP